MYRYICIVRGVEFHFLVDSIYFRAVLDSQKNWMVKDFLYSPYLPIHTTSSTINIKYHSDTFVIIDELILIHQYHWCDDTSLPLTLHSLHEDWFFSVQFSCSAVSDSLWPREPQHARPPCPSPTPGIHPNPCPLSRWCHPTISSSVISSSLPQSLPASGSSQMSQLFTSGGQSIGVSASISVLPMTGVLFRSFDKCVMTYVHYCGIIQGSFRIKKNKQTTT